MITRQRLSLVEEELDETDAGEVVPEERGPCPQPPDNLSWEGQQVWLSTAPDLWIKGRLHGGTVSLLTNYCVAIGKARQLEAMLEVDGDIVKGKPHPAFRMMLDAMGTAKAIASELRFAREHINEEANARDNGWDQGLLA